MTLDTQNYLGSQKTQILNMNTTIGSNYSNSIWIPNYLSNPDFAVTNKYNNKKLAYHGVGFRPQSVFRVGAGGQASCSLSNVFENLLFYGVEPNFKFP